jgi:hypothetical protein
VPPAGVASEAWPAGVATAAAAEDGLAAGVDSLEDGALAALDDAPLVVLEVGG